MNKSKAVLTSKPRGEGASSGPLLMGEGENSQHLLSIPWALRFMTSPKVIYILGAGEVLWEEH